MLLKRLISAIILLPIVLAAIFYSSVNVFWFCIALVLAISAAEWCNIFSITASKKILFVSTTLVLAALLPNFIVISQTILYLVSQFWLIIFIGVLVYNKCPQNNFVKLLQTKPYGTLIALALGAVMLIGIGLSLFLFKQNNLESLLVVGLIMIWSVDTGAYFTGKSFGGGKLIPNVSPGKTWSGAWGGLMCLLAVNSIIYWGFDSLFNKLDFITWVLCTLVIYIYAVFGDLAESMFKRIGGIKDSGSLIPGHGGILDRIDSIITVLPIYWLIIVNIQ